MPKMGFALAILFSQVYLSAAESTYSEARITDFYDTFVTEEEAIVGGVYSSAGSGTGGTPTPPPGPPPPTPPPPPPPPLTPLNPAPMAGYLPVVIMNTTGLPDDTIYVTLAGQQTADNPKLYFFELGAQGIYSPVLADSGTYSPNYSYLLTELPKSSTGDGQYLVYAPNLNGARFYFTVNYPVYLQSDKFSATSNAISAPNYFAFYDPNYNTLLESVEITYKPKGGSGSPAIPWTATVNTTEVDAFGFPIGIAYYSYSASSPTALTPMIQVPNALPSGFGTIAGASGASLTRGDILTYLTSGLASGDLTGHAVWPQLAIPFYTDPYAKTGLVTYLRVLSPKQSVGLSSNPVNTGGITNQHVNAAEGTGGVPQFGNYNYPPFPLDYINNPAYDSGTEYTTQLFGYYTGGTKLYLSTGGDTPTVYEGVTTGSAGSYVLTFTGVSGPNKNAVCVLNQADMNTFKIYSGVQLMSGTDGPALGHFFCDAYTVGFLPSTKGTVQAEPINITDAVTWQPANIPDYYVFPNAATGGPWLDLYAQLLHHEAISNSSAGDLTGVGLCYGYDFDDSLGMSGALTPANTTSNSASPYLGIKLGAINTDIPDSFSNDTAFPVTFNYPVNDQIVLQYQQGNGPWTTITNGETVPGLQSSDAHPLRIRYNNTQGPYTYHEFLVSLYYQQLIPIGTYNRYDVAIINATTITPNSSTPTAFTIDLLP